MVEVAKVLRGGAGRFLRVLALVYPPGMSQSVFMPAISNELPDTAGPGTRKCKRLEGALGLGQIDQVLRQPLLPQHARNHFPVAARAAQAVFHDGAAARRLKEIQKGE